MSVQIKKVENPMNILYEVVVNGITIFATTYLPDAKIIYELECAKEVK